MKTKRLLLCLLLLLITQSSLLFFGCGSCKDNYDNVSIELDKTVMTIFMDETLNNEGDNKLKATILGLDEGMVDSFSFIVSDPNVATMKEESKYENSTDFVVTPYMGGETEIYIISNETSTKSATLTLRVVEPLKNVEVNESMNLFVSIGKEQKTLSVTPNNALKFTPETTSEKFFSFEVLNYSSEVAFYDNTTNLLTIMPEIEQGILELKATFDFEKEKNTFGEEIYNKVNEISNSEAKSREDLIIKIYIIKEIDSANFVLSEGGTPLSRTDGAFDIIELVQNHSSLSSKEITASLNEDLVATEGFTYNIDAKCISNNDIEVSRLSEESINNVVFNISAVFQNENAIVEFYVTIKEVDGFVQKFQLPFKIILIPETIKINNDDSGDPLDAVVYSRFQNNGTKFTIEINPIGAENRKFYIDVLDDFKDKIEIVNATDGITLTDKQILQSGQSVFIRSKNNAVEDIYITIVSVGTSNYENINELTRRINLKLVIGAEKINTLLENIYIEKDELFIMEYSFDPNDAFTEYVYAKAIDPTICQVPAVMDGTQRALPILGLTAGKTTVIIELSNGVSTTVNIICYITFEDFGVTLPSVNDVNSPVSEAIYTTNNAYDTSKVKTITSAQININGTLYLGILPYNVVSMPDENGEEEIRYLYNEEANNPINFSQVFYSSDTSILKIDSSGYMTCLKEGNVTITCTLTVYKNLYDGTDSNYYGQVQKVTLEYSFTVDVIIPIESFEIIGGSINVYAYNRLSYYDQIQNAGTITVNLKITPSNATYDINKIVWSVDSTYLVAKDNVKPSGMSVTYNCYLIAGQNVQTTSVNVSLSVNSTRNYASSKTITISSPRKVSSINLNSVPDYILDGNEKELPYLYFDGRKGLNDKNNSLNLGAECIPQNAYNTKVRYIVGQGLGGDPNPIVNVDEKGNIIPISNGYCYLYVVAEDWFTTATDYSDYQNYIRTVAVKVADGKTKATAIDINSASELMGINTLSGLELNYVLQSNIDLTNYPQFNSFGLFEENLVENNITTTVLNVVPFTGTIDACYNVFGTPVQYKITGLSIKNTKYVNDTITSLYYNSSTNNNYTLHFGLFAVNKGEISNLICDVSSIMISSLGLDDRATTNFGVLAGVNNGLIENCEVKISNLSGNDLYVNANTTYANIGIITGLNQGYVTKISDENVENYVTTDACVNNCITDGTLNVKIFTSTQKESGESVTGSRNTVYIGGLVGKNETNTVRINDDQKFIGNAIVQTLQDDRNEKYKNNHYSYYNGNITFEAADMNARGTINVYTDTINYINPVGVGGICGYSNGKILNIASEISINTQTVVNDTIIGVDNVGGIVGINDNATLQGVYFSGTITANKNVGGIAGKFSGTLENGIAEFMDMRDDLEFGVTGIKAANNVGALIGYSDSEEENKISYSFARSYFVRRMLKQNYIGDIYVYVPSTIENKVNVGGLVGLAKNTLIYTSYSYINIYVDDVEQKANVGGICGYSQKSVKVQNCYLRGIIYIASSKRDGYNVTAISNNAPEFTAEYFYSTCSVFFADDKDYAYLGTLKAGASSVYVGVQTLSNISGYNSWSNEIWGVANNYNSNLPYIVYNGKKMLTEPPTSISYEIMPSTITSTADLYRLNKFIKVDNNTILLFKYDNIDLDSYNLNKILKFTIPPNFIDGKAQFDDMTTIRLTIKSSDPTIAHINTNGNLTLYGEGSVQITIASMLNKNAFTTITIVVMNVTTGFEIYNDNLFQHSISSSDSERLLIKKGTNLEIYPYISGNTEAMIEYSTNSSLIYPVQFANSGDWVQKDGVKSCMDITYSGTHVIQAINPGKIVIEARLFVYINNAKVYLPYVKSFVVQSFEGLNDFTISHTSFSGIIKDRYEFTAKVSTDIVDKTVFDAQGYILDDKNNLSQIIECEGKKYNVNDVLDINILLSEKTSTYAIYAIYVEVEDEYKASQIFFTSRNFIIKCNVDDGQGIDYGINQELNVSIGINPQDVSSVETMFFGGAELIYDTDMRNPMYNVAEVDTDVITAGEIGIFKVFIYPEFSQIKNIYIYATSTDGNFMSIEQVALRKGTVPGQNTYFTLSPAPANYSTIIDGTLYKGLHASVISNVVVEQSVITSKSFDGYLYFRCLTGSEVELGTIYTVYVKIETYDDARDPIIKRTLLYAEERVGITLFYENSLNNSNFEFITSYNNDDITSSHTLQFITRRIGENPKLEILFYDENNVNISESDIYINTPIYYTFTTDDKMVETENISYRYYIKDLQIPSNFEGTTIYIMIKATNTEDNNLVYYSNKLLLRVVPYIVTDIVVDGVNNQNEFIKAFGGSYTLNVNISTSGNCKNSTKMSLKKSIATNSYTWWYYDFNQFDNVKFFNTLQSKTYEFFTISKNGGYYVYTPDFVGFTDKIYMVVSLYYFKGDADNSAGYIVETNAGPIATEAGINPTSQTINFVLEFTVSSNYRNSEEQALPIYDQEGLENMEEGVYYILDNDVTLENWTPLSTAISSLDGNGYEINIKSFNIEIEKTIDCYLGLFAEVPSNTTLKNLYITYGTKDTLDDKGFVKEAGYNGKYEFALDSTALTTLYFGGVAAINNGTIYNCSVKNADGKYYFEFLRTDNKEVINYDVKMAGLVALNKGSVSYSRSELTLVSNVGNMGGLVSENQGTLSSSYYKNGKIVNNSTNSTTSKVAGVCVTNTVDGRIYYSYVEGSQAKKNEFQFTGSQSGLTFAGNIAGFVYENKGIISDCYANIPIRPAGGRNAGFVYSNMEGEISCCYTLCKFIYQSDNGTNASDTPFVGTDAQGQVNFDSEKGVLKNVYYYVGDFIHSVIDREPAEPLTKVQFMEDYYFGEYSFSYKDDSYTHFAYEEAYDMYGAGNDFSQYLTTQNSYAGLDAIWTYDEYHLYPKLVEANNISVSRKEISFKPFVDVFNYYSTMVIGYNNTIIVATNKLEDNQMIRLSFMNGNKQEIYRVYSDSIDHCSLDQSLSTYYISMYNFSITPDEEVLDGLSKVTLSASVVQKDYNVEYDQNNNPIYSDRVLRTSDDLTINITPESDYDKVKENEYFADEITEAMNIEYSTNPVTGVKVSETLDGYSLYSAEPGTKGNPETIADATQYNSTMYFDPKDVEKGLEQSGNYRVIADIDFSNTHINENSVNNVFSGRFDGAGFTIEGLTLIDYSKTIDSFGLFNTIKGSTYGVGVVKNLRLEPLKVYANYIFTVGTLSAKVVGGRVYNIIVDADEVTVKGKNIVGGVIGMVLDNIKVNNKYYEFLSDDLVGTKTIFKSMVQNITSTINVNATSRVSSTNFFLISNINSQKTSFYEQNVKVAYSGVAIGAVIQSSGTNRLDRAGVYDIKVVGKSVAVGEIIGTAIGFVGEKSYVDLVSVKIHTEQYLNATLIAGGVVGENRGLVSRATIEHQKNQDLIDAREEIHKAHSAQNVTFFKNAKLVIGGVIGFNNGGILENSYSRIDVRNTETVIAGGLVGIVIGGEFYNSYVSGSVYARTIIGGVIGATSTPELFAPLQTAVNSTASLVSSDSNAQISRSKEVILDSILGLNKWLEVDYSTFYENVHNSNGEVTDAYPIGSLIGSIQLNSKDETNSYEIITYSCSFKKLYVVEDEILNKYFRLFDYGNKINSLVSSGVAYSNTQNSLSYENNYAEEIFDLKLQNNNAFKDYSTTIWEYTNRASTQILPILRSVSNLNTKKSTLTVKYVDENSQIRNKVMLLIDGINGEESVTKPLGTSLNPYKIVAPNQLRYFALHNNIITNGQFKEKLHLELADNISLIAYSNWIPIGDGIDDYKLTVIFDGNGYQISGITSHSATTGTRERLVGLFGYLQTGSVVSNLRTKVRYNLELEGGNIYVGGIVATAYNTSIKNCETEGKINFLNKYAAYFSIGGIVGQAVSEGGSSSIENSNSYVEITSKDIVSRVQVKVSGNTKTYVDSVYKDTKVNAKVGGIAGFNQNSIIANCNNSGSITIYPIKNQTPLAFTEPTFANNKYEEDEYSNYSVFEDILYIGGIVGSNVGQVKNSTNFGTLYSYSYVGGIAGINHNNSQIAVSNKVYNINECINAGSIYLTAGYARSTAMAGYAGGIAGYSNGSINECANLNLITAKTYCPFNVGGIVGAVENATNLFIGHSYVSAYTEYNNTKNVITVESITKFKSKDSIELVYGYSSTSSSSIQNKAGLICNKGTEVLGATTQKIIDNLVYGDINVNDASNKLTAEVQKSSEVGIDGKPLGYASKVSVKQNSNYILESVISKGMTDQATYGQTTVGSNIKAQFGIDSQKEDISFWVSSFYSVPNYITGGKNINISELRWNAKVFTIKIEYKDADNTESNVVSSYISANFIGEDKKKNPIGPDEEKSFFLATTSGYIEFTTEENWEIYYIMVRRSDSNDYREFNESDLISTILTINGFEYEDGDSLMDLSPEKDVKFTIIVKIRPIQVG